MRATVFLRGATCAATVLSSQAMAQTNGMPMTASSPNSPAVTSGEQETQEIIVTASRRSESIREVPTAVSAFGTEKLRENQVTSLNDLSAITPSVQISTYLTNANITIRGIGNGNFINAGGDPGVAVHQNGVYLGQASLALMTFLDVQRVEVLRGPQGTLFGRNATGGAVNIIANTPTKNLSYGVDISAGIDPTMVRSSGYISGPLNESGTLLARISAEQNYNRGFSRNLSADGPRHLDGNDDFAVRGQLEWRPTDRFSVRLLAEYAQNKDNGSAIYLAGTPSGAAPVFPFVLLPLFGLPPVDPIVPTSGAMGDPKARDARVNLGLRDMNSKTFTLTANWALGGGNLAATASYNDSYNQVGIDADGTSIPYVSSIFTIKADQRYGELLYTSDASLPLTYVLGANFYDEHLSQRADILTLNYAPLIEYHGGGTVDTTSYAAFGHVDYKILPSTKIFAGARYSHDKKSEDEFLLFGALFRNNDRKSWSRVTCEAGVSSDLSRSVTAYVKYATGYKSGGYSVGALIPAFNPETNKSIEAGLKGSILGGALQANLAAFHMKYSNLQVTQVVGLVSSVTNAAKATVKGVELESVLHPTRSLRIELTGAWLDSTFDRFSTTDSARPELGTLNLTGNRLPNAPRWAGSIGISNDFPISGATITPAARFDWKSRLYFTEFNIPIASQKAIGKLNLYLNYKSDDGRWTGSIFATNVTDRQVKANVTVASAIIGSLAEAAYQPGRQLGASIGYHFQLSNPARGCAMKDLRYLV